MNILGLSAFYHDAAACLVQDGVISAAVQEERFSRKKHDASFPKASIQYCLTSAKLNIQDIDQIVFYEKPLRKLERVITFHANVMGGFSSFAKSIQTWLAQKMWTPEIIRNELNYDGEIFFLEHHVSHAASAFFPSPFSSAAILVMDGVGEWATVSSGIGKDNEIHLQKEIRFPHSLGLLYSAFTAYLGFAINDGEYKIMGLAPYGEDRYSQQIKNTLIDIKPDGSFALDLSYFDYCSGSTLTNERFHKLFGGSPRLANDPILSRHADIACSIQVVTEEIMVAITKRLRDDTEQQYLCMAGGVALNCVANGRIQRESGFDRIWIQPAAGDAGAALGAALYGHYQVLGIRRRADNIRDRQLGSFLGPEFSTQEIEQELYNHGLSYEVIPKNELHDRTAELLAQGAVIGWFQGRMEFGPRSLGARSILADPRPAHTQSLVNQKIKFRESFRPFAPSILADHLSTWFELPHEQHNHTSLPTSHYMLQTFPVHTSQRILLRPNDLKLTGINRLAAIRSTIPSVTHVDYSARVHAVDPEINPSYYALLSAFFKITNCPILLNTSFNVRDEPIVCSPADAIQCFQRTALDILIIGTFIVRKSATNSKEDMTQVSFAKRSANRTKTSQTYEHPTNTES